MVSLSNPIASRAPLHHVIVAQRHPLLKQVFPVLYLFEAGGHTRPTLFRPLLDYCRETSALSGPTHRYTARGLGLLHDYVTQRKLLDHSFVPERSRSQSRELVVDFLNHFKTGTLAKDLSDPLHLHWPPCSSVAVIQGIAGGLERFFDSFLGKELEMIHIDGSSMLKIADKAGCRSGSFSFLKHIKKRARGNESSVAPAKILPLPTQNIFENEETKRFPADLIQGFLTEGFVKDEREKRPDKREDLTGKLCALSSLGGGRGSERLHMWVNDLVARDDRVYGFLRHPQRYVEGSQGLSREQYLLCQNLLPRNLEHGRLWVGWKDPGLNAQHWAHIHFLSFSGFHALLEKTLMDYLRFVRAPAMLRRRQLGYGDHPWLFVSQRHLPGAGCVVGDPWSRAAMRESWARAIRRYANVVPERGLVMRKDEGTTPHGVRHLFGSTLDELGFDDPAIQKMMHHKSILSSRVYRQPSASEVSERLTAAQKRREAGDAGQLTMDPVERLANALGLGI